MKFFGVLLIALMCVPESVWSRIIYVSPNGSGLRDGTSWGNAVDGINKGLLISQAGDQLWVKKGSYPSVTLTVAVELYGGFEGNETTIDDRLTGNFSDVSTFYSQSVSDDNVLCINGFSCLQITMIDITSKVIIQNNNIGNGNAEYGISVADNRDVSILNNIISHVYSTTWTAGIEVILDSPTAEVVIQNNLIAYNVGLYSGGIDLEVTDFNLILISNNTIAFNNSELIPFYNAGGGITTPEATSKPIIFQNNLLFGNKLHNVPSETNSMRDFRYCAITNQGSGTNVKLTTSPFVSETDLTLRKDVICVNKGTPDASHLSLPATDLAGRPRIADGRIDIGAYEYSETVSIEYTRSCQQDPTQFYTTGGALVESYLWQFGDTNTSTEAHPMHTYATPGEYTVTLQATYTDAHQEIVTKEITIYPTPKKPIIIQE